jgi:hypothetical protein
MDAWSFKQHTFDDDVQADADSDEIEPRRTCSGKGTAFGLYL